MKYETECRKVFDTTYLKVFIDDDSQYENLKELIGKLDCVRTANITESQSSNNTKRTLTVYPKRPYNIEYVEKSVKTFLNKYTSGVTTNDVKITSEAHFKGEESKVINAINSACATIDVCMAWFTNENILKTLEKKQAEGVKVRVITFKDGVNKRHGVDLSRLEHKELRGEHGGIMHNKFCVVDNWTMITGSYNWTTAAETRNDENALVEENNRSLASSYTKQFNELWQRGK